LFRLDISLERSRHNRAAADHQSLTVDKLPPPTDILGSVLSFQQGFGSTLDVGTQDYLSSAIAGTTQSMLTPMSKSQAAASASALGQTSFIAGGIADIASIGSFADFGLGFLTLIAEKAQDLPQDPTTALAKLSQISLAVGEVAGTAATCGGAVATGPSLVGPVVLGGACVVAVGALYADYVAVPIVKAFSKSDPPDQNFQTVVVLPSSLPGVSFHSGSNAVDNAGNQWLSGLERAAAYLLAVNISINRYSTAVANGDASSAVLQLEAILHYLALYKDAIATARAGVEALKALPEIQALFNTVYDATAYQNLVQQVLALGLSSSDLSFLSQFGIDSLTADQTLANFLPPMSAGTLGDQLAAIDTDFGALTSASSVPEPSSLELLFVPLVGFLLLILRPRKRPSQELQRGNGNGHSRSLVLGG
jgi:hypothetical protein